MWAYLGLASPVGLGIFLDWAVRDQSKEKLAQSLLRIPTGAPTNTFVETMHELQTALQKSIWIKPSILALASILSIVIIFSIQYIFNAVDFHNYTKPFLILVQEKPFSFILYLLCFIIADVISFIQTYRFLMLSKGISGPVDLFFIIMADLMLSLGIAVTLLPFLISIAVFFSNAQPERHLYFSLDTDEPTRAFTLTEFSGTLVPWFRNERANSKNELSAEELYKKLFDDKWSFNNFSYSAERKSKKIELSDAANGLRFSGRTLTVLSMNNVTPQQIFDSIEKIFGSSDGVKAITKVDYDAQIVTNRQIYLFEIEGSGSYELGWAINAYFSNLGDVNFFNSDAEKIRRIGGKIVSEDAFITNALFNSIDYGSLIVDYIAVCGEERELRRFTIERKKLISTLSDCKNAVVAFGSFQKTVSNLLSLKLDSNINIPILPTALSSLFVTALIYVFVFI